VTLSFNLAPGVALGQAVARHRGRRACGRQAGLAAHSFQGNAQAFQATVATQPYLILAAIVAVYIVLGLLYESAIHPITILSTCRRRASAHCSPHAGRYDLSVIGLIGIILLIGIVKKNAIMMNRFRARRPSAMTGCRRKPQSIARACCGFVPS